MRRRLGRLVRAFTGRPEPPDGGLDRLARTIEACRSDLARLQAEVAAAGGHVESALAATDRLMAAQRASTDELASLAALPVARLRSDLLRLEGSPARRLGVRRHAIGAAVALPVRPWMGVTTCVTASADVRELWEHLLATEAALADPVLRGDPGSVLELTDVVVSNAGTLRLQLQPTGDARSDTAVRRADVAALPRFAYDFPARKLRNAGHWLLDCVPQAWALAAIAPDAVFLLPQPAREAHWSALALAGITPEHVLPWNGEPIACRRLLAQETDGRIARGRPLPMLLDFRRHVRGGAPPMDVRTRRRIFVSRRDAKRHRQWMSNHDEVEALFRSRGFEILVMRESSMAAQLAAFRDAGIVAGISGAGLANVVFSPPGAHVVTLLTDSLMRWYAEERGSRSAWAGGTVPVDAPLTELSDSPRFYAHLAAACEQHCHTFVGEDALPVRALERFLDDVLGVVERG